MKKTPIKFKKPKPKEIVAVRLAPIVKKWYKSRGNTSLMAKVLTDFMEASK